MGRHSYPGEEYALIKLASPHIYGPSERAEAALKLREIDRIHQRNEQSMAEYRARQAAAQDVCPTCGK